MNKLTFTQSRARFAKFGRCEHDEQFNTTVQIPKTNVFIKNCKICGHEISRWYENIPNFN